MKFAALFGLAAIAAAAASTTVPAFAAESDEPAHVSRNWKSAGGATVSRGTAANQRDATRANSLRTISPRTNTATSTVARDTSNDDEPEITYTRPGTRPGTRPTHSDDGDGDNDGRSYSNRRQRHHEYGGLDPDEAARIRYAHRESDRRITLHRDHDYDHHDYSVPSYSTRGYRRHHWWSFWW